MGALLGAAVLVVACSSEESARTAVATPDAATSPANPGAGDALVAVADPAVEAVVEGACPDVGNCPDGRQCLGLGYFGVGDAACGVLRCQVCLKPDKTLADIACPPGKQLTAEFVGRPNWRCE